MRNIFLIGLFLCGCEFTPLYGDYLVKYRVSENTCGTYDNVVGDRSQSIITIDRDERGIYIVSSSSCYFTDFNFDCSWELISRYETLDWSGRFLEENHFLATQEYKFFPNETSSCMIVSELDGTWLNSHSTYDDSLLWQRLLFWSWWM